MNFEEIESLLTEAEVENQKGKHAEAERLCNLALEKISLLPSVTMEKSQASPTILRAIALNHLSGSLWRRGMAADALPTAEKALSLSIQSGSKMQEAIAHGNIGMIYYQLSDLTQAQEYCQKAIAIHEEIGNKHGIATNLCNIGNVYFQLSDYSQALANFQRALAICEEIGSKNLYALNLYGVGMVYHQLSDYTQALEYYQKALTINEEIDRKIGIANNLGNIGSVYEKLTDITQALFYFQKALSINEEIGNNNGIAVNLGNIGNLYFRLSDYPQALANYQKALTINKEIGNKNGIGSNLGNIGNVYYDLSDYTQALVYYQKALTINEEIGLKYGITSNLLNIGRAYSNKKFEGFDASKAEDYLQRAQVVSKEIGNKYLFFYINQSFAILYENEKKWKKAHEFFVQYHNIEKEVLNEEATKQAQQMENRRKVEEAERDRQVKLARFQEQEKILHNILPAQIAERILEGEKRIADLHEHVSVFFSDIVGFTKLSQTVTPDELLTMLNEIFSEFDRIARKHGLEKIKTIGDAYMAVAGVPMDQEDHAERAAAFAIDVIEYMKEYRKTSKSELQIRVGLHCGKAIAGVIGENKFAYDLWGDSVNTASRMESHGEPGKIHVSEDFRNALKNSSFQFADRGEMEVKGKGEMKTYFLEKES